MIWSTSPSKMFLKIPPKFHNKTLQSIILWLNLNKINEISFLQSALKQGSPSFHFHAPGSKRRYPCTQTASAVPKYFSCQLQFCTGYRIWHSPRAWKRKTLIFTQLKISRYNQRFFATFRRILSHDLWPIYCVLLLGYCHFRASWYRTKTKLTLSSINEGIREAVWAVVLPHVTYTELKYWSGNSSVDLQDICWMCCCHVLM